jgi:hypothetical protein
VTVWVGPPVKGGRAARGERALMEQSLLVDQREKEGGAREGECAEKAFVTTDKVGAVTSPAGIRGTLSVTAVTAGVTPM